jgi:hypothetical protein
LTLSGTTGRIRSAPSNTARHTDSGSKQIYQLGVITCPVTQNKSRSCSPKAVPLGRLACSDGSRVRQFLGGGSVRIIDAGRWFEPSDPPVPAQPRRNRTAVARNHRSRLGGLAGVKTTGLHIGQKTFCIGQLTRLRLTTFSLPRTRGSSGDHTVIFIAPGPFADPAQAERRPFIDRHAGHYHLRPPTKSQPVQPTRRELYACISRSSMCHHAIWMAAPSLA